MLQTRDDTKPSSVRQKSDPSVTARNLFIGIDRPPAARPATGATRALLPLTSRFRPIFDKDRYRDYRNIRCPITKCRGCCCVTAGHRTKQTHRERERERKRERT
ncbi:hypothetical protein EVAR_48640_1 [Eumeta japonica]|uniref:Uncharacterized protein n=1 Tax=Eumeta variegata TaxID=151549 RepID=A0A4C1XQ35_EUMVA|nr:hypothetical protein EVAR_48640_1 [Eumeta japonica]